MTGSLGAGGFTDLVSKPDMRNAGTINTACLCGRQSGELYYMKVILHLGTYKTGTSSFQNIMFDNREVLQESGILYPLTGLIRGKKLGRRHSQLFASYLAGATTVCPPQLLEEMRESDAQVAILSSEAWSSPGSLPLMTQLVTELRDHGFSDFSAIITLRNLEDYQLSHYREFTVNQRNARAYPDYIRQRHGAFNYLFLIRAYRAIFGDALQVLPYNGAGDMVRNLLSAMQLKDIYDQLPVASRSNIKSVTPLEVEAMRCANFLKTDKQVGLDALQKLLNRDATLLENDWGEAFPGHISDFGESYMGDFQKTSNWSDPAVKALFAHHQQGGRSVSELTKEIIGQMKSSA